MGLFPFRSDMQNFLFNPRLFSVIFFIFLASAITVVSAESNAPELPGIFAVYAAGEEITVGGETNLAPGTIIIITIEAAAFRSTEKGGDGAFSGTAGTVEVQGGTPPFWSFSFITAGWKPGEYLVTIEVPKTGTVESGSFSLLPARDAPGIPALTLPTMSPGDTQESSSSLPVVSPTSVPLSSTAGLAGLAVVYLFRHIILPGNRDFLRSDCHSL